MPDHSRGPNTKDSATIRSSIILVTVSMLPGSPALQPAGAEPAEPAEPAQAGPAQGMYFAKKQYVQQLLPKFAETKDKLPGPIYDENPLYVKMYWKAWELAFRNFYEPKPAKGDFVGWTGIVPILYFLEYGIGLRADAPNNRLTWVLTSAKRCGCERFRFNGHTATLIAQPPSNPSVPLEVTVESDGQFQLLVERDGKKWDFTVKAGKNRFTLDR
jgi:hypothetical protein